jgi:hypothetical protein
MVGESAASLHAEIFLVIAAAVMLAQRRLIRPHQAITTQSLFCEIEGCESRRASQRGAKTDWIN